MATITRAELMEHIAALCGDTSTITGVYFTRKYIDVYRIAQDADGKRMRHGDSIAIYSERIMVVD